MPDTLQLAIDIGNSRIKLGIFAVDDANSRNWLCRDRIALDHRDDTWTGKFHDWLTTNSSITSSYVSSVNPPLLADLLTYWPPQTPPPNHIPRPSRRALVNRTRFPEKTGADRLFNAVAANAYRSPHQPVIIVDAGTATTVDLVDAAGDFLGGTILPGIRVLESSLRGAAAQLRDIQTIVEMEEPNPVGRDTQEAIRSGLHWGMIGGIREVVSRIANNFDSPLILLTGGDAFRVAPHILSGVLDENLTLLGLLLAAHDSSIQPD